jgi:hypothetical protein
MSDYDAEMAVRNAEAMRRHRDLLVLWYHMLQAQGVLGPVIHIRFSGNLRRADLNYKRALRRLAIS